MAELAALFFVCALLVAGNWLRSNRIKKLELTPNCLLTRYPVVFLTGQRSLLYFRNYWNTVPQALAEHGYDVHVLEMPWRKSERQALKVTELLSKHKQKYHLVGDTSVIDTFALLARQNSPWIVSLTVVSDNKHLKVPEERIKVALVHPLAYRFSAGTLLSRVLLFLHNGLLKLQKRPVVHALEVGLVPPQQQLTHLQPYLRLCIFLAEDDARW